MIAEFTIENFCSIKSPQTISFEPTADGFMADEYTREVKPGVRLLKLGVVYGANASGKSNILAAVDFFKKLVLRMPNDRNEPTRVVPFMLDDTSRRKPTRLSMAFFVGQSKYILGFELDQRRILSETLTVYDTARPARLYSRSYDAATDSTAVSFGPSLRLSRKSQDIVQGNTINNSSVLAAFGKSNVERTRLNDVYDYFATNVGEALAPGFSLSHSVKARLYNDATGYLKKFVLGLLKASDFNIEDISLRQIGRTTATEPRENKAGAHIDGSPEAGPTGESRPYNVEMTFSHKAGDRLFALPEERESNGTMRFLSMAATLCTLIKSDHFVPIDEVETSLHYELLAYFLKVFLANSEGTSQMLLTTHDINLLNEDFIRRDTIWFTDKDERGETKALRLSSLGLHKNLSPYNAYRQGKLVKLPFLGSQYLTLNNNQ